MQIGEGYFGRVYKGLIRGEGLKVAVKKFSPESFQAFEEWQLSINIILKLGFTIFV